MNLQEKKSIMARLELMQGDIKRMFKLLRTIVEYLEKKEPTEGTQDGQT